MERRINMRFLMSWTVACLGASLLAACATGVYDGATSPPTVVSFGDSLSDLGTYASRTEGRSEGRFTTNPGPLWIELVAQGLGSPIAPHRRAGWGQPPRDLGGTAYGEGGSRIALQPGSNNTDATAGAGSAQTTLPVRDQVSAHLAARHGRFAPSDIVFVWAGANDLFRHAFTAAASSDLAGEALVREAARDLVAEVRRIGAAGGHRVVVLNLDDYGKVPLIRSNPKSAMLSSWTRAFNDELAAGLAGTPVLLVDAFSLLASARQDPARYGLKNSSGAACKMAELPQRAVVFCTAQTLVEKDAHLVYLYADGLHPTTAGHRIIAAHVLAKLAGASAKWRPATAAQARMLGSL